MLRSDDRPMSSQSLVKFGQRNPENHPQKVTHHLKLHGGSVINRQYLSRTLSDCCKIWHDDATQDCGGCRVAKIHLRSKPKLLPSPAPHSVRNSNFSSVDYTILLKVCTELKRTTPEML